MPFLSTIREDIFFSRHESGSGGNLLLIHGSGGDQTHWPAVLRHLESFSVYALDLPGHGGSTGEGRKSVEAYADCIQDFVTRLSLSKVVLAGHSLGGAVVQVLALRSHAWLWGIVLVGTGARLRVAPAVLNGLLDDFPAAVDLICRWAYGPTASPALVEAGRRQLLGNRPETVHGDYCACDRFDVMDRVHAINCPTLIVSGAADKLTPLKYGEYLHQRIPGARMEVIPDAGHMMALEKPSETAQAFRRFLESLE